MNMKSFRFEDLQLVIDPTPVEHIGGPDDGDFLPICANGRRRDGLYVPVNDADGCCVEKRFVPARP